MSDRLSRAVSELAAALREIEEIREWEVVGETSPERSQYEARPGSSGEAGLLSRTEVSQVSGETKQEVRTKEPCGSDIAYKGDWRCYIILQNPADPSIEGFVEGPNPETWRHIEGRLAGRKLRGSGARLRRVENRAEAEKVWKSVFPKKPMPQVTL